MITPARSCLINDKGLLKTGAFIQRAIQFIFFERSLVTGQNFVSLMQSKPKCHLNWIISQKSCTMVGQKGAASFDA